MPGAEAPASVRVARYHEPRLNDNIVRDAHGTHLVPCIAHGDFVKVESLQSDHLDPISEIKARQEDLIKELNSNPAFAKHVMSLPGMDKFFAKNPEDDQYYGTLFFYDLYFNDIDNIWLICQACNHQKNAEDTLEWLKKQWLYGQEFLDYLGLVTATDEGLVRKAQTGEGLAEVAISWFWERHANYVSVSKKLFEDVTTPVTILNKKVDHVIGSGNEKRAARLAASLEVVTDLLGAVVEAPVHMDRRKSEGSAHSSSNDSNKLNLSGEPTVEQYRAAGASVKKQLPGVLRGLMQQKIKEKREAKRNVSHSPAPKPSPYTLQGTHNLFQTPHQSRRRAAHKGVTMAADQKSAEKLKQLQAIYSPSKNKGSKVHLHRSIKTAAELKKASEKAKKAPKKATAAARRSQSVKLRR